MGEKNEKREELKQRVIEFLKENRTTSIPSIAKAIGMSSYRAKSLVEELEVEKKVRMVRLGREYVVQLEEGGE